MLTKSKYDDTRGPTRTNGGGHQLATIVEKHAAANAGHWETGASRARRQRRQRRISRSAHRAIAGWTVRAW